MRLYSFLLSVVQQVAVILLSDPNLRLSGGTLQYDVKKVGNFFQLLCSGRFKSFQVNGDMQKSKTIKQQPVFSLCFNEHQNAKKARSRGNKRLWFGLELEKGQHIKRRAYSSVSLICCDLPVIISNQLS